MTKELIKILKDEIKKRHLSHQCWGNRTGYPKKAVRGNYGKSHKGEALTVVRNRSRLARAIKKEKMDLEESGNVILGWGNMTQVRVPMQTSGGHTE